MIRQREKEREGEEEDRGKHLHTCTCAILTLSSVTPYTIFLMQILNFKDQILIYGSLNKEM